MQPADDIEGLARGYRERVAHEWGAAARVAHLVELDWLDVLPTVAAFAKLPLEREAPPVLAGAGPMTSPFVESLDQDRDSRLCRQDWFGEARLAPGTGREVRLWRSARLGEHRVRTVTFVAFRERAHVEQAFAEAAAAWRTWRRTEALVQTSGGRVLEGAIGEWAELILPAPLRDDIRQTVEGFSRGKDVFAAAGLPWKRGLLFHGPPGNGKTLICRAVVGLLGWPAVMVSPTKDTDEYDLRSAMEQAEMLAPAIVCFEDVDSLFGNALPLSAFLNVIDGFEALEGVLLLATTNHPEKLDTAITSRPSRFDRVFHLGPPRLEQRRGYLGKLFGARLPAPAVEELAQATDGFSMAFLKELFVHSMLLAANRGDATPANEDLTTAQRALSAHLRGAPTAFSTAPRVGFVS